MANALKCPNPTCPYLFDPSRVPAGAILTCPRCGMRFTLGPPVPQSGPIPNPARTTQAPANPHLTEPPANRPVRRQTMAGRASSSFQTFAFYGIGAVLLAGVATAIYFKVFRTPTRANDTSNRLPEFNLTFEPPPAPWVRDEEMRVKIGTPYFLVYRRADPEAYMAFGAKDYETRPARPSELREGLTSSLARLFDNVQLEEVTGAKWLGQPAVGLGFRAQRRGGEGNVAGECHAVGYKGVGYWTICWAGERDVRDQSAAFEATRGQFQLIGPRDDWKAKESPVLPYRGDRFDYQLIDSEGVWKAADRKPELEDPKADLFLVTRSKKKGSDFAEEGALLVCVLDSNGGDPLAQGRKYVEDEMNKDAEARGTNTFQVLTGPAEGDPASGTVEATAPVVRLRSKNDRSAGYSWLIVVSAIKLDDKLVVAHARCPWPQRAAFETKFVQITSSLRPGK